MSQDIKCFVGLHKYEVLETSELKNAYGIVVGKVITSRCSNCGKIKSKQIPTDISYRTI